MKILIIFILYLGLIAQTVFAAITDPVGDYLSHTHLSSNNQLLQIKTTLGPDSSNVIFLSTTKQAVSGGQIWEVYASTAGGYLKLTSQEQTATENVIFNPDQAVVDESSHSLIYFVNGGGGHGALRSIKIVNGAIQDSPVAFMGPDTKDPDWVNYKKYFTEDIQRVPVKSLKKEELSTPSQIAPQPDQPSNIAPDTNTKPAGQMLESGASQAENSPPQATTQFSTTPVAVAPIQPSGGTFIPLRVYGIIILSLSVIVGLWYFFRPKK
jgi:hypothetical protein